MGPSSHRCVKHIWVPVDSVIAPVLEKRISRLHGSLLVRPIKPPDAAPLTS